MYVEKYSINLYTCLFNSNNQENVVKNQIKRQTTQHLDSEESQILCKAAKCKTHLRMWTE